MSRFTIVSARDLVAGADITDEAGIYLALVPAGESLLTTWGYLNPSLLSLGKLRGTPVFYIGSTVKLGLRTRLGHHVGRDSRQSTLRQSIGLLLASQLDLSPIAKAGRFGFHFGDGEPRLTQWLTDNVLFAYRAQARARSEEASLIDRYDPPLNIYNRRKRPFARRVLSMREQVWMAAIDGDLLS